MKISWEQIKFIALKVFCVLIFLLLPGIRGYDNWLVHQYLIAVVAPIIWIIFFWKKDSSKNSDNEIME
jgi:hypothetical protein